MDNKDRKIYPKWINSKHKMPSRKDVSKYKYVYVYNDFSKKVELDSFPYAEITCFKERYWARSEKKYSYSDWRSCDISDVATPEECYVKNTNL